MNLKTDGALEAKERQRAIWYIVRYSNIHINSRIFQIHNFVKVVLLDWNLTSPAAVQACGKEYFGNLILRFLCTGGTMNSFPFRRFKLFRLLLVFYPDIFTRG